MSSRANEFDLDWSQSQIWALSQFLNHPSTEPKQSHSIQFEHLQRWPIEGQATAPPGRADGPRLHGGGDGPHGCRLRPQALTGHRTKIHPGQWPKASAVEEVQLLSTVEEEEVQFPTICSTKVVRGEHAPLYTKWAQLHGQSWELFLLKRFVQPEHLIEICFNLYPVDKVFCETT